MESAHSKTNVKPPRPLAQNRRQANRHRLNISATLILEAQTLTEIPITITEMSVGGLGFRARQSLPIDGSCRISSFDTLIPQGLRATIVSQRKLPDGEFEIGAKTL